MFNTGACCSLDIIPGALPLSLISQVVAGANVRFGPDPLRERRRGARTELGWLQITWVLGSGPECPILCCCAVGACQSFWGLFPPVDARQMRGEVLEVASKFHSCCFEFQTFCLLHAVFSPLATIFSPTSAHFFVCTRKQKSTFSLYSFIGKKSSYLESLEAARWPIYSVVCCC